VWADWQLNSTHQRHYQQSARSSTSHKLTGISQTPQTPHLAHWNPSRLPVPYQYKSSHQPL